MHDEPTLGCTVSSHWDHLRVVAAVDTTTLYGALGLAWASKKVNGRPFFSIEPEFANSIAGLLRLTFRLSSEIASTDAIRSWVVVRAFLWTVWQRALMLYFWWRMKGHLDKGYNAFETGINVRGLACVPEIFTQRLSQLSYDQKLTPYMCNWAYEHLRNDRAATTTDLRRFHWCYNSLFEGREARCRDNQKQCEGGSPENCQRFRGAVVADQSVHDLACDRTCGRLFWDRASFINVSGARALCLATTDDKNLRYCTVSERTLAISHVWSHGQGGRPDTTGFNACLHKRFKKLVIIFGCDSYWMDTPCIPNEKALRAECINNINRIFALSKVTLVCDRDIMGIEISDLTMDLQESVLATLLVCDWNLRAWTLLEAMRGRQNIHLLCEGNQVLSVKNTLKNVHEYGRIDLVILLLTCQHLLPQPPAEEFELFGEVFETLEEDRIMHLGFINLGEASILLSHRHLSRDGDDVVIWSLLANEKAMNNVVELWKSHIGHKLHTGFLMSSSPRLQGHRGLSWAPSCPSLRPQLRQISNGSPHYLAYDGLRTRKGTITSEGLQAQWLVHRFNLSSVQCKFRFPVNVANASLKLQGCTHGAFLRPVPASGMRYVPAPYLGKASNPLVAVCGSIDGRCWEWRGVFEWANGDPLPDLNVYGRRPDDPPMDFLIEDILLV